MDNIDKIVILKTVIGPIFASSRVGLKKKKMAILILRNFDS